MKKFARVSHIYEHAEATISLHFLENNASPAGEASNEKARGDIRVLYDLKTQSATNV